MTPIELTRELASMALAKLNAALRRADEPQHERDKLSGECLMLVVDATEYLDRIVNDAAVQRP